MRFHFKTNKQEKGRLFESGEALDNTRARPKGLEEQDADGRACVARLCRKKIEKLGCGTKTVENPIATENRILPRNSLNLERGSGGQRVRLPGQH